MPKTCPCGEYEIIFHKEEKVPRCSGGSSCKIAKKESIIFFASRAGLEIDGMGKETVEILLSTGLIGDIEDIFNLKYDDLVKLPQWENKKASNLINAINKSTNSQPSRLLTALGIRFVGKRTVNLLFQNFGSIENILAADSNQLEISMVFSGSVINSLNEWKAQEKNITTLNYPKRKRILF